ncbi:chitin synthase III catalytic subunit-domain-containing protein [Amanita rubescens]|nr:chitin synthase III catalytic subunit-domain-containing protein [Amanita rubescens]
MGISFCQTAALVICPLLGSDQGRKDIVLFFWTYMAIELLAMFLDSGITPTANTSHPWFAAVYTGLVATVHACLLINGFVGFQFAEDGTPLSLWVRIPHFRIRLSEPRFLRISVFGVSFFIVTFKAIFYGHLQIVCVVIYIISQLILVFRTLEDRWPLGDIVFCTAFYAIGQALLFAFGCNVIKHYIDGLFFFTLYPLEHDDKRGFGVFRDSKATVWEVKDLLLTPGAHAGLGGYDDDGSAYHAPPSLVGGVNGQQYYQKFAAMGYPLVADRY